MTASKSKNSNSNFQSVSQTHCKKQKSRCDAEICCLGCLSLIPGFKKKVVSAAAFFPPSIPGYFVVPGDHPEGPCPAKDCLTGIVLQALEYEQQRGDAQHPILRRSLNITFKNRYTANSSCSADDGKKQNAGGPGSVDDPLSRPQADKKPLELQGRTFPVWSNGCSHRWKPSLKSSRAELNGTKSSASRVEYGDQPAYTSPPASTVYLTNLFRDSAGKLQPNIQRLPTSCPAGALPFCHACIRIVHMEIPINRGRLKDWVHAFWLIYPGSVNTIIFSHGNSTDIGLMFPYLVEFSRRLRTSVVSYDFAGYGASTGTPSETGVYEEVEAVFRYLTSGLVKLDTKNIILYGLSVGSAPSIELATKVPDLGGLIIHAGMKSGLTVLKPDYDRIHWFDVFKNISKMARVLAPVFVIHGKKDIEVAVQHGMALYRAAANPRMCWWVEGAGHNDIEILYRDEYYARLNTFIKLVSKSDSAPSLDT